MRENELRKSSRLESPADEQQLQADANNLIQCMIANNSRLALQSAHLSTLRAWCQLVIVFIENCQMEAAHRESFILQALQLVLSRLERSYAEDMETALLMVQLGRSLLQHSDLLTIHGGGVGIIDVTNDRYNQLFRNALVGIQHPDAAAPLREACCLICYDYLQRMSNSERSGSARIHALQNVRATGGRLIEVLCDDAYAGEGPCRVAALLLLSAIIGISNQESTKEVLESLGRFNFVQVMVDNIRNISVELQECQDSGKLGIKARHDDFVI